MHGLLLFLFAECSTSYVIPDSTNFFTDTSGLRGSLTDTSSSVVVDPPNDLDQIFNSKFGATAFSINADQTPNGNPAVTEPTSYDHALTLAQSGGTDPTSYDNRLTLAESGGTDPTSYDNRFTLAQLGGTDATSHDNRLTLTQPGGTDPTQPGVTDPTTYDNRWALANPVTNENLSLNPPGYELSPSVSFSSYQIAEGHDDLSLLTVAAQVIAVLLQSVAYFTRKLNSPRAPPDPIAPATQPQHMGALPRAGGYNTKAKTLCPVVPYFRHNKPLCDIGTVHYSKKNSYYILVGYTTCMLFLITISPENLNLSLDLD
ncbi:hypothetical protein MMC22_002323 [Lobaria immixta]|nr:hypothetical protein [Lobaria immixta]